MTYIVFLSFSTRDLCHNTFRAIQTHVTQPDVTMLAQPDIRWDTLLQPFTSTVTVRRFL